MACGGRGEGAYGGDSGDAGKEGVAEFVDGIADWSYAAQACNNNAIHVDGIS